MFRKEGSQQTKIVVPHLKGGGGTAFYEHGSFEMFEEKLVIFRLMNMALVRVTKFVTCLMKCNPSNICKKPVSSLTGSQQTKFLFAPDAAITFFQECALDGGCGTQAAREEIIRETGGLAAPFKVVL